MAENSLPTEAQAAAAVENRIVIKAIASERTSIKESRQLDADPFDGLYGDEILRPLYDPELLIKLPEESDILQQCVDAYKTNTVGFGYNMKYDVDYDKLTDSEQKALDTAWTRYQRFFDYCNLEDSFTSVMEKVIDDKEKIGWGCAEVLENGVGEPAGLEHIPAHRIRLTRRERKAQPVTVTILDEAGKEIQIEVMKKFRRYVQIIGGSKVYFKEFGDPRVLNCKTGQYSDDTPPEDRATCVLFFNNYCSYTEYGLPRYLGQLLNIRGSRKAEELNYSYFEDGRHIPLAILVENGKLTKGSYEMLEDMKGGKAKHRYLILEAEGLQNDVSIGDDNRRAGVSIKFEPLAHVLEKDGLFQEYCANNRSKIRSAFRLHPIYTGESQDYTRATADTARQITEEQVFQPERERIAFKLNNLLKPALGIAGVSLEFKAPTITDGTEVAAAIAPYVSAGAATPNMLIDALGDLLGKEFEPFEGEWADKPMALVLAELSAGRAQQPPAGEDDNGAADEAAAVVDTLKGLSAIIKEALNNAA